MEREIGVDERRRLEVQMEQFSDQLNAIFEMVRPLAGVPETLRQHGERFDRIDGILAVHTEILREHSATLAEHSTTLAEHGADLREIRTIVAGHTGVIADLSQNAHTH